MKGVILAGGEGSRLRPLTAVANKHLLPVYDRPMILFPIETLKTLGVDVILVVSGGEHIGTFAEFLGDGSGYGVDLTYRVQTEAGGIAQALGLAEEFAAGDDVVVILGDNIYDNDALSRTWNTGKHERDTATLFIKEIGDPERFGVPEFDAEGKIQKIIEKPENPPSRFAITGLYVYPNSVFEIIPTLTPSARGELEVTDINNHFVSAGACRTVVVDGFWSDAGTFETLLTSSQWRRGHLQSEEGE